MATVGTDGALEEYGFYWEVAKDISRVNCLKEIEEESNGPNRALRCWGSAGRTHGTASLREDGLSASPTRYIDSCLKLEKVDMRFRPDETYKAKQGPLHWSQSVSPVGLSAFEGTLQ